MHLKLRVGLVPPLLWEKYFREASDSDCVDFLGGFKASLAIVAVFEAMVASCSSVLANDHKMLVCFTKWQKVFLEVGLFVLLWSLFQCLLV